MSGDLPDDAYRELQREYLQELPTALAELRSNVEALRRGESVAPALKTGFHRLAGSGGSYGFPEISEIARGAEHFVASSPSPTEADKLEDAVRQLEAALARAVRR
jgi:HPt (histidine-containing phosphotransfer) domain-containing protein